MKRVISSQPLKSHREITTGAQYDLFCSQHVFTVFLSVHNGAQYLDSLLKQIQSQRIQHFPLIIVDNGSTDNSWEMLCKWPSEVLSRTKLIRNGMNFGGGGSLFLNLGEVETEWLISWHQDDVYLDNYLLVMSSNLESMKSDAHSVVFTDMGTLDNQGAKLATPIRQSWIADLATSQSAFLANLVQQSVAYPSAAFRTAALREISIPWHSSSFPDTEITLLQAAYGKFKFIPKRTMLYRMNPKSESHDLNPRERVLGPFASLARVMASDSFIRLCRDVEEKHRTDFARRVLSGIDIRLGESQLSEMVKLIAAESMALTWDYAEPNSREQILRTYKLAEDGRTTRLLDDLGVLYSKSANPDQTPNIPTLSNKIALSIEEMLDSVNPPSNTQAGGALKAALTVIAVLLPLPVRRVVVRRLVKMYVALRPKSAWNLSWNPKN